MINQYLVSPLKRKNRSVVSVCQTLSKTTRAINRMDKTQSLINAVKSWFEINILPSRYVSYFVGFSIIITSTKTLGRLAWVHVLRVMIRRQELDTCHPCPKNNCTMSGNIDSTPILMIYTPFLLNFYHLNWQKKMDIEKFHASHIYF